MLLLLSLVACKEEDDQKIFYDEGLVSMADFIEENQEQYASFNQVMLRGQLKDPLSAYNPFGDGFTLFLPTDEAFEAYVEEHDDYSSIVELLEDEDFIRVLGRYHLVNTMMETNEFPYGALPDTTATGDYLTIGFSAELDSTVYKVNNVAPVVQSNLEMINGFIHVIEKVLQPVNYTGYDWLYDNEAYSILAGALELTGLKDTLGLYRTTSGGQLIPNKYTLFAEHDSIFTRNGIHNLDDLIDAYATPGMEYTDPDNGLYQFAAYHVMEGSYFLVDFENSGNYNTFATAPMRISTGLEVNINPGVDTFRIEIDEFQDTTYINYLSLYYQESNILTKNGAIHFLSEVMEYYTPPTSVRSFEFYEEPEINRLRNTPGTHFFNELEQDELEVISWTGPDFLVYYKSSSASEPASQGDYITLEGNFVLSYDIPKILPGTYTMYVRAHAYNRNNEHATINIYMDGKRMGGSYDLNTSGQSASAPYHINNNWKGFNVGSVEFSSYSNHTITIESLIPGVLIWDNVRFEPE